MTARWSRRPLFFLRPAPPFSRTHSPTTLASRHCLLRLMIQATGTLSKENAAPLTTMASAKAVGGAGAGAPAVPALRVKKLHPDAVMPKRGSSGAAGYDLTRCVARVGARGGCAARPRVRAASQPNFRPRARFFFFASNRPALSTLSPSLAHSCADVTVPPHGRAIVPTGLALAAPPGTYARVAPRSGLAVKHFIDTGAGVVDEDYRGEVGVVLFNHGEAAFEGVHCEGWASRAYQGGGVARDATRVRVGRSSRHGFSHQNLPLSLSAFPILLHSQAWRPGRPAHPGAHRHAGGGRGG